MPNTVIDAETVKKFQNLKIGNDQEKVSHWIKSNPYNEKVNHSYYVLLVAKFMGDEKFLYTSLMIQKILDQKDFRIHNKLYFEAWNYVSLNKPDMQNDLNEWGVQYDLLEHCKPTVEPSPDNSLKSEPQQSQSIESKPSPYPRKTYRAYDITSKRYSSVPLSFAVTR